MRVHTYLEMRWDGQRYVEIAEEGFDCPETGFSLCKGADSQQTDLANNQSAFYKTLTNDYNTQFANQSNILNALNANLSPVVNAGPSQFGYSTGQVNALNSQALQGTAQSYQNAQRALQNQQASRGGGNAYLPSGVDAQNNASLASSAANTTSNQLLGIQNAGYEQGNRNYNNAVNALGGVASQYNPTGYAGASTSAGGLADEQANTIQKLNAAASPWSTVGGLLGGVAGSFLGPIGASLGSKVGGMIGGGASGGGASGGSLFGGGPNELDS